MYVQEYFHGMATRLENENKYSDAFSYFNKSNKDFDVISDVFLQLVMFWQLHLSFGKNFYPKLHKMYREIGSSQLPNSDSGDVGKQLFIYMTSLCANRNLSPFFEMWGIIPLQQTLEKINSLPSLTSPIMAK